MFKTRTLGCMAIVAMTATLAVPLGACGGDGRDPAQASQASQAPKTGQASLEEYAVRWFRKNAHLSGSVSRLRTLHRRLSDAEC
jgi:hypothetical protein